MTYILAARRRPRGRIGSGLAARAWGLGADGIPPHRVDDVGSRADSHSAGTGARAHARAAARRDGIDGGAQSERHGGTRDGEASVGHWASGSRFLFSGLSVSLLFRRAKGPLLPCLPQGSARACPVSSQWMRASSLPGAPRQSNTTKLFAPTPALSHQQLCTQMEEVLSTSRAIVKNCNAL